MKHALIFISIFLFGCASANYKSADNSSSRNEGIFVIGVKVNDMPNLATVDKYNSPQIEIGKAKHRNGEYKINMWIKYTAKIIDDYAVISLPNLKENEIYFLLSYRRSPITTYSFPIGCKGTSSTIFNVKPGSVTYLGNYQLSNFDLERNIISWLHEKKMDTEEARNHLILTKPELSEMPYNEVSLSFANIKHATCGA